MKKTNKIKNNCKHTDYPVSYCPRCKTLFYDDGKCLTEIDMPNEEAGED